MATTSAELQAPSLALLLAEPGRALAEFGLLVPGLPLLCAAKRGDGHPVLVLPGMAAGDSSTLPLRGFLKKKGYAVYGWEQGRNNGSEKLIEPLQQRLALLRRRHGAKVSLIGWSLGGIYARELAKLAPQDVRCVITLGSPFKGPYRASNVWRVYEFLSGRKGSDESSQRFAQPPPVPATAIFSRSDGIVAWQRCTEVPGAAAESVEVDGSHSGLGHNALALYVMADRLAEPDGDWHPFRPGGALRFLYRNPWRGQTHRNAQQ
ncbi:MAG: esterase/lipase family protein [Stenotrophobium sp.]